LGKPFTELNKQARSDVVELQNTKKEKQDKIFSIRQEQALIESDLANLDVELNILNDRAAKFSALIAKAESVYNSVYNDYVDANTNSKSLNDLKDDEEESETSIKAILDKISFEKEKIELEALNQELHSDYSKISYEATSINNFYQAKLNNLERKLLELQEDLHIHDIISIHEKSLTENENEMKYFENSIQAEEPILNKLEAAKEKLEKELNECSVIIKEKENEESKLRLEMSLIVKAYENDNFDVKSIESFFDGYSDDINLPDSIKCGYCFSVLSKDALQEKINLDKSIYSDKDLKANSLETILLGKREEYVAIKESLKMTMDELNQAKMKLNYSKKMFEEKIQKVSKLKGELDIQRSKLKNKQSQNELTSLSLDTKEEIKLIKNIPEMATIKNYANGSHNDSNLYDIKKLMVFIDMYQNKRTAYDTKAERYQNESQKYIQEQEKLKTIKEKIILKFESIQNILRKHDKPSVSSLYEYVQNKHEEVNTLKIDQGTFQKDLDLNTAMRDNKKELLRKYEADIDYISSGINTIDEILAKDELVQKKLNILNVAKVYFKQDGLAKHIRKFYIDKLNSTMSSYVHLFNFGFLPQIDETAGIVKYWKYSGGQKIAIAILMKIILNFILKNPIKMLILDEPTPYMDNERVEAIRDLVDKIKNILQVIVITHDVEFMNIECNKVLM